MKDARGVTYCSNIEQNKTTNQNERIKSLQLGEVDNLLAQIGIIINIKAKISYLMCYPG